MPIFAASMMISRLKARGWVRRARGPKGRATFAVLTDEGYRKLMATGPIHFREVRRLVFDVLTRDEVKALEHVTGRINAGLFGQISLGMLARGLREHSTRQSR